MLLFLPGFVTWGGGLNATRLGYNVERTILTLSESRRGGLEDFPFSYRSSGADKVFISWRGKPVMTLKGKKAMSFLDKISKLEGIEEQLIMAKITGNFKRGNEK